MVKNSRIKHTLDIVEVCFLKCVTPGVQDGHRLSVHLASLPVVRV